MEPVTPFSQYKFTYDENLLDYLRRNPDANEESYIESEIGSYNWLLYYYENTEDMLISGSNKAEIPTESEYHSAKKILHYLRNKENGLIEFDYESFFKEQYELFTSKINSYLKKKELRGFKNLTEEDIVNYKNEIYYNIGVYAFVFECYLNAFKAGKEYNEIFIEVKDYFSHSYVDFKDEEEIGQFSHTDAVSNLIADKRTFLEYIAQRKAYLDFIERHVHNIKSIVSSVNPEETKPLSDYNSFKDIFVNEGFEKYILALTKCNPPLLNSSFEFIGKPRRHKGVVCSWIKHLQTKGIIKQQVNRSQLSFVLNNQMKNINIGKDGKSFDIVSNQFRDVFEIQLLKLTN